MYGLYSLFFLQDFNRALQLDPRNHVALRNRGCLFLAVHKLPAAEAGTNPLPRSLPVSLFLSTFLSIFVSLHHFVCSVWLTVCRPLCRDSTGANVFARAPKSVRTSSVIFRVHRLITARFSRFSFTRPFV